MSIPSIQKLQRNTSKWWEMAFATFQLEEAQMWEVEWAK